MSIRNRSAFLAAILALVAVQIVSAQQRVTLDQAEALIKSGQLDQARALVDRWKKENPPGRRTDANALARVLMMSAQLESRAEAAEDSYLAVALTHPTSPFAAEAWLRLGQARLAAGDSRQALTYLQRLMSDYPHTEHRGTGAVWLARAQQLSGKASAACATITDALKLNTLDSAVLALLRSEETNSCDRISGSGAQPQPRARFAIQVAAFREMGNAQAVARQLEKAGFDDVRIVTVPENTLIRVRIGAFETAAAAVSTLGRLNTAGYTGVVVTDATREANVRN